MTTTNNPHPAVETHEFVPPPFDCDVDRTPLCRALVESSEEYVRSGGEKHHICYKPESAHLTERQKQDRKMFHVHQTHEPESEPELKPDDLGAELAEIDKRYGGMNPDWFNGGSSAWVTVATDIDRLCYLLRTRAGSPPATATAAEWGRGMEPTLEMQREIRRQALEEAARACDAIKQDYLQEDDYRAVGAAIAAKRIRALASSAPAQPLDDDRRKRAEKDLPVWRE